MKSRIIHLCFFVFSLWIAGSSILAQNSHLQVVNSITISEQAGKMNIAEFWEKDSAKIALDFGFKEFWTEMGKGDEEIHFKKEEYAFVIPDSTIVDEVELMNQLQGCPIDLKTEEGKRESRRRLQGMMWIIREYLGGNKMIPIADVEVDDDNFFKYNLGWFKLSNGIIVKLQLYASGGLIMLWPQEQSSSVNRKYERFLVAPIHEKNLCANATSKGELGPNMYDKIPDIRLPGINGDTISLYSLKGKFVYVDFWASWCSPCRAAFPKMIETYNKYRDKVFTTGETGFEVFAVSLDSDKQKWLDAIQIDGTIWPNQVMDADSWKGIYKNFLINGIPGGILIDGNGIIVRKWLDVSYLEKCLK